MGYGCGSGYTEAQTISQICTQQWLGALTENSSSELGKVVKLEELCEKNSDTAVKLFMKENQIVIEKVFLHLFRQEPGDYLSDHPKKWDQVILFMRQPALYECFTDTFRETLDEQALSA